MILDLVDWREKKKNLVGDIIFKVYKTGVRTIILWKLSKSCFLLTLHCTQWSFHVDVMSLENVEEKK